MKFLSFRIGMAIGAVTAILLLIAAFMLYPEILIIYRDIFS